MASDTAFADQILSLSVTNGLVRIDFGTVENYKDGDQTRQRSRLTQRVVMPLAGFAQGVAGQQRLLKGLADAQAQQAAAPKA